jgi:hypothetical protein
MNEVTNITMDYDKYSFSHWEGQNIFVASRESESKINQEVTEIILTLRAVLVKNLIEDLKNQVRPDVDNSEVLEMIRDYNGLLNNFSEKLGRVIIN